MKLTRLLNLITKIIQKSENITLIENENLKSELLHYSLTVTLYNILKNESYRYKYPVLIELTLTQL